MDVKGTGFGLVSLTKRYALLSKRKIEIINENDYFIVKIPLI
jgi:hypothetical protein